MTVLEYCPSDTQAVGEVATLLRARVMAAFCHQDNLFDTFIPNIWREEDFVPTARRRRYTIEEMLDGVTENGIAALNQTTSWVQNDPSAGREL